MQGPRRFSAAQEQWRAFLIPKVTLRTERFVRSTRNGPIGILACPKRKAPQQSHRAVGQCNGGVAGETDLDLTRPSEP